MYNFFIPREQANVLERAIVIWLGGIDMVRARCFSLVLLGLAWQSWGLPSSLMLVSGVTSSQEMCLVGRNGSHS